MAYQEYFYPAVGGDYRWHIFQKCLIAIGREPFAVMNVRSGGGEQTTLRFDPPLDTGEEALIDAIFADPGTACNSPVVTVQDNKYQINDIYEWRAELEALIGFPVWIWFVKSAPEVPKPDIIELQFGGRVLNQQDKKAVTDALDDLMIGWV